MQDSNYLKINKASWNKRTEWHIKSDFYNLEEFKTGKTSLQDIELKMLGDIRGKSLLHLQCHFGQDTLSLERMGAITTGIDLSNKAIDEAKHLTKELSLKSKFICSDVYKLPEILDKQYDIVFTTYGTIGWLPDIDKWAEIVSKYLKPGGKFIFVEFHPLIWMFDNDLEKITYSYFKSEPMLETESGSYANKDTETKLDYVSWNHGIAEVLNSLIKNGLEINDFQEYPYSPYDIFKEMIEPEKGKYTIKKFGSKIPLVYSIIAIKKTAKM
jgi:2-polyprenyl-3-methyl-5-hydroxy-6-metoxy-1,4-benzoquinol methylase